MFGLLSETIDYHIIRSVDVESVAKLLDLLRNARRKYVSIHFFFLVIVLRFNSLFSFFACIFPPWILSLLMNSLLLTDAVKNPLVTGFQIKERSSNGCLLERAVETIIKRIEILQSRETCSWSFEGFILLFHSLTHAERLGSYILLGCFGCGG